MGFMNLFKTFLGGSWGVHPADCKRPAADQPVRRLPLPPRLHLMLSPVHKGVADTYLADLAWATQAARDDGARPAEARYGG